MSDTTYRMKPNRVDRVHEPDDDLAHVGDECDDWEGPTTEVTRLHEELEDHLERSERRLVGTASKLEQLQRWFFEHPATGTPG